MTRLKVLRAVTTILLCAVVLGGIQNSHAVPMQTPISTTPTSALFYSQLAPGSPCLSPSQADISTAQSQPAAQNVSIPGHVVSNVLSGKAFRKGILSNSTVLHLQLVLALRNPTAFKQCLASLADPASSNYEHFLNVTTLQPYVPTPGQKQSMTGFLEKAGFTVSYGPSPIVFQLTGTVSAIWRAFGTRLRLYEQGSNSFYSPDTEPKLPRNLAALTNAIRGLDNFSMIRPSESPCSGPYCPQGLQIGYGLSSLFSSGYDGAGQMVAIVAAPGDSNAQGAIDTFSFEYGLPSVTLDIRYPDGVPTSWNTGWAAEAAMDVEAVHSVAPGAGIIVLYDTEDLMNSVDYVAYNHLAPVVSNSWIYVCGSSRCSDTQLPAGLVSSVDSRLGIDAALGVTILFASGDEGAKPDGTNPGTEFPASDPNVLAVGATNLALRGCGTNTCAGYGTEIGASISGGGYSGHFPEPTWQTNSIGVKPGRAVPDVSMFGYSPGFWVYSTTTDTCTGGGSSGGWFGCAGTSLSTPLWAGFLALALQARGGRSFGNISPRLYQLAHSSAYSNDFHDITSGSNNGYSAVSSWDPVTGWGTPIAQNLAYALSLMVYTPVPLSSLGSVLLNAPANSVYFIFPDGNPAHKKPSGVTYAQVTDWTGLGFAYGSLSNMPQIVALDTNGAYIDQSTGAPKISNSIVVLFGGAAVNELTHYYEANGITPLYWSFANNYANQVYYDRTGQVVASISSPAVVLGTQDMPLIEAFKDPFGNTVIYFGGFGWRSTFAAGLLFKTVLIPQLSTMSDSWYFWSWQDQNGNGFPEITEINTTPVNHGN
jgi:hypothetical protein